MATAQATSDNRGVDILARLNRIPVWSLPRYYLVVIGLGYFFTFYDITDIGFALPAIADQFGLTGEWILFSPVAAGLLGYILGSLVIGQLADRYGRYRMLLLTFGLAALGSFGDAASPGLTVLIIFRFITGVGVGADLNLVSTYISELAPPAKRGRITLYAFIVGILGQAVTPFVALALVPTFTFGWRILFLIGGAIAVAGLALRTRLPESPRWQVGHGHEDSAEETVARMERNCRERNIELPEPKPDEVADQSGFPIRFLFRSPYVQRLALFIPLWFLWYIGNYAFLGDAPELISQHGSNSSNIGGTILYLAIGSIGYPIGAFLMSLVVDRIERKYLIFGSSLIWLAGMLLIGSYASEATIYLGTFLAALSLGSFLQVTYTFTAESFPTRARSTGFGFSDGIGHAGGAAGVLLMPLVVEGWSFFAGFALIGCTGALAGIIALIGPAVTGRHLEQVSK